MLHGLSLGERAKISGKDEGTLEGVLCCRDLQVQPSSDTHDHVWRGVDAFIQHSTPAVPTAELGGPAALVSHRQ